MSSSFCVTSLVAGAMLFLGSAAAPARAAAAAPRQVSCRVVRVAAGPHGIEGGGDFRLQEERTAFSRVHDTQVIVYFKWEATPGLHRLSATWRSPGGGSSASNTFDYKAADRLFGAYWTLPISPATATGRWTIDADVDGFACGSLSFDVVDADARPAGAVRRPLAPSEIFDRLQRRFAVVERIATGRPVTENAAAFLFQPGALLTAFAAVDAAQSVYVTFPVGVRREVTSLLAVNRQRDWALLQAPSGIDPLPVADVPADTGDRCYSLEGDAAGARVLAQGTIIGKAETPRGGRRLIASFETGEAVPGAPVVNEFGEAIGFVAVGLTPAAPLRDRLWSRAAVNGVPVVPLSDVALPASESPVTLEELRQRGVVVAATSADESVMEAGFAREIQRSPVRPIDQRTAFTAADRHFFVFVAWAPKARLRGSMKLCLFDGDNRLVAESKPSKADLKPGSTTFSQWELPIPPRPDRYHADVVMGTATLWRGFVTIR